MLQVILQFLYDLYNSQYFGILLLTWVTVDVIWVSRWQALLDRIARLLKKPLIFTVDNDTNQGLLYPRKPLEQLARRDKSPNQEPSGIERFLIKQREQLFNENYPLRTFTYIVFSTAFIIFVLADMIVVAQTLELMGLEAFFLPPEINKLSISFLGGGIFAAVIGLWVLIEASGDDSRLSLTLPLEHFNSTQKGLFKIGSVLIIIISIISTFAFVQQRLIEIGQVESDPTVAMLLGYSLYGLLFLNNFIAAAITATLAAVQGILVVLYIIAYLVMGLLPVIVFIVDIVWRIVHILLDILIWFVITPFMVLPYLFIKLFNALRPTFSPTPPSPTPPSPTLPSPTPLSQQHLSKKRNRRNRGSGN